MDHIAEIRVFVGDYHSLMCSPLDLRRAPQTLMDARFSLPFLVAAAAVRRQLSVWGASRCRGCKTLLCVPLPSVWFLSPTASWTGRWSFPWPG